VGGGNLLTGGELISPASLKHQEEDLSSTNLEQRCYKQRVQSLSRKFRQSQIKAAVKVNRKMLAFYWELGRDIVG